MEFQIAEAIELIKTLAETENLTQSQALTAFVAEAELDVEYASILKAALFEEYTLQEMASDSMTKALYNVFVSGAEVEDVQEMDTKETQEGTKYKVRVKDRASGSTYSRYATRAKIAELRANPNIASVELSDYGTTGEDDRGEKTAAAKGGGMDRDGDGKVESSSKEHAGVVHNAIQRKMGGKPDGKDTRKEEFELEEGKKEADLDKMKRQENKHTRDSIKQKGGSRGDSKNRSFKMASIRDAIERGEDPRRDTYGGKRTRPEDHRKAFTKTPLKDRPAKEPGVKKESAWETYLELRENRRAARAAGGYVDDSKKQTDPSKKGFTGISNDIEEIKRQSAAIDKAKKKVAEGYKGKHGQSDSEYADSRSQGGKMVSGDSKMSGAEYTHGRRVKAANPGMQPDVGGKTKPKSQGKMDKGTRADLEYRKANLKKEEYFMEADLVDAGRENQTQRDKKKLSGNGVDNSREVRLMPYVDESVVTEHGLTSAQKRLLESGKNLELRSQIKSLVAEECCDKCGTPECTCESKKEEKKDKKKSVKIDESGMPILEYSRNNARPGPSPEMINPGKDPEGDVGHMNPKGKPKRYKNRGEAPGDRRPNDPTGPELPFDKGTVPNGSGV